MWGVVISSQKKMARNRCSMMRAHYGRAIGGHGHRGRDEMMVG